MNVTDDARLVRTFAERLNSVLDARGVAAQQTLRSEELAEKFDVSSSGARKWLLGLGLPSPAMLVRVAAEYDVTIDWLFGLSDEPTVPTGSSILVAPVYAMPQHGVHSPDTSGFELVGSVQINHDSNHQLLSSLPAIAMVRMWADMPDLGLHLTDVVIVGLGLPAVFEENAVYLLRDPHQRSYIRRVEIGLNGDVGLKKRLGTKPWFQPGDLHLTRNAQCSHWPRRIVFLCSGASLG
jgi:transcriptional regulator with XRE-family HTH domain